MIEMVSNAVKPTAIIRLATASSIVFSAMRLITGAAIAYGEATTICGLAYSSQQSSANTRSFAASNNPISS